MRLEDLLDRLVPDADACRAAADALRRDHPGMSPVDLARQAIRGAKLRAAATGAATGAASSPLTMIPAAVADIAAVLKIEGSLVGTIAALLDPASLDKPGDLRGDVLGVVFPAAASQALRQMGIRGGEQLSQAMVRRYLTEDAVRTITRLAARYLGKTFTREAVVRKAIPLVGMGIGAGWNWIEVQAIGARAIRYYSHEPIGPAPGAKPVRFRTARKLLPRVARFLPGQKLE